MLPSAAESDNEFECGPIETSKILENALEIKKKLQGLADDFADINRRRHRLKAVGSAVSLIGSVAGFLDAAAHGASLDFSVIGFAVSISGSYISSKAESQMVMEMKKKHEDLKTLLVEYEKQMNKFKESEISMNKGEKGVTVVLSYVKQQLVGMQKSIKPNTKHVFDDIKDLLTVVQLIHSVVNGTHFLFEPYLRDTSRATVNTEKVPKKGGSTVPKNTDDAAIRGVISIGLTFAIAAIEFWQFDSAVKAAISTCDAEKELRSCVQIIENAFIRFKVAR